MTHINADIINRLKVVKLLVLDFDGVLTDNKVLVAADGGEYVTCNRSDGMGLSLLKKLTDVFTMVLSTETNRVVEARCKKLKLECCQGIDDKISFLRDILQQKDLGMASVAYIGNDVNDLQCIEAASVGVAVADAYENVKSVADIVLDRTGGNGAVREFCDILIKVKQNVSKNDSIR